MRLLELEVQNIRGLRSLHLTPEGENLVIWGPNGVGKSGVVDAIEFVLTGDIGRLTGEGTGGVTLRRYGPHVDHDSESAIVRAVVKIDGLEEPVTISRSIGKPGDLQCPESVRQQIAAIGEQVRRGQAVLTRRDILTYISATPGDRAAQIQHLLNLDDITSIRAALVTARNKSRDAKRAATRAVNSQKSEVNTTLGWAKFDEKELFKVINESRLALSGQPLSEIRSAQLTEGLARPLIATSSPGLNPELLKRARNTIREAVSGNKRIEIYQSDRVLREIAAEVRGIPNIETELQRVELIGQGLKLVSEETDQCPLCGASWQPGHLRHHLEETENSIKELQLKMERMEKTADLLVQGLNQVISALSTFVTSEITTQFGDSTRRQLSIVREWHGRLSSIATQLENPIFVYPNPEWTTEEIASFCEPNDGNEVLEAIEDLIREKVPQITPQQTAWETLIRLQESIRTLENRISEEATSDVQLNRADTLLLAYEAARDSILNELYNRICDNFASMYRVLHEHEGEQFNAHMGMEGAALKLEVEFFDRGSHPPNALHSEGHQDSMGVCLFLALGRELSRVPMDLVVLDDVVMSVDASHRKEVCQLFKQLFSDRQFIITTHDKTWATQLKQSGVVAPTRVLEFTNWTVDDGPQVHHQIPDVWEAIGQDLSREDIKAAAFKLRNGSEEFFESVCDALQAEVSYNTAHQWQLDHFLPAAMDKYRSLIRSARNAARSWKDQTRIQEFDEKESIRQQIYSRTYAEQWNINAAVHFNNWQNLTSKEFTDVVEAFRDLHFLFLCTNCLGLLRVLSSRRSAESVKCPCGSVAWNLKARANV